jgi:bacterioferritin-associated ferredoxin
MYVCLCNSLTDNHVRDAIAGGACRVAEIYGACGCRASCGGCAQTVLSIIRSNDAAEAQLASGD